MATPSGATPSERLRRAVVLRVAATSLRHAAKEIGVSASGLRYFLTAGGEPYGATRRKLERWYVRRAAGAVTSEAAFQALLVLVQGFPPVKRSEALDRLVGALEESFEALGEDPPAWLEGVRQMTAETS